MKMNRLPRLWTIALAATSVAVVGVGCVSQGASSPSAVVTDSGAVSTETGWDENGVPTFLKTPKTGNKINAPARDTVFACVEVHIPGTPAKVSLGPILGSSMTQAQTPWVKDDKVIIAEIERMAGSVSLKSELTITETDTIRHYKSNGIPNHPIGVFPIPKDSPAYQYYAALPAEGYDNAAEIPVGEYDLDVMLPLNPQIAEEPNCIKSLMTGFALTGAAWHIEMAPDSKLNIFDPNAALPTDECFGHPYEGEYHYHGYSWKCMEKGTPGQQSPLLGYALDGFGIYGPLDANGEVITNAQLDECHGRVGEVNFNGKMQNIYHYVLNNEYPYSIGCLKGTPLEQTKMSH